MHSSQFAMPNNAGDKLYLIWDYRKSTTGLLNLGTSSYDACCNTPVGPVIPCSQATGYQGLQAYPDTQVIELGTGTGVVTLDFNAFQIPDRFTIEFDGSLVVDTGYRGDTSQQGALNTALADLGAAPGTIVSPGSGTVTFNKSTATTTATLRVYAPLDNTQWRATVSCVT